jgi:tricorn protease
VQSTGVDAQNELVRQFMAQWKKDGPGHRRALEQRRSDPGSFIELLNRPILATGPCATAQPAVAAGRAPRPQVMLINGWSGSGGDAFPFYFREAGLRTAHRHAHVGGLIGISGAPALADGGERHGANVPDV